MTEYKTFFIASKLLYNSIIPLFSRVDETVLYILYGCMVLCPLVFASYIVIKKRYYVRKYLCRTYTPSMKLIAVMFVVETPPIVLFYVLNESYKVAAWHGLSSVVVYGVLVLKKQRSRNLIKSNKNIYVIGIVSRDIGVKNGLKKGQPVQVVRETDRGYIVRDADVREFMVERDDIEEVIKVV